MRKSASVITHEDRRTLRASNLAAVLSQLRYASTGSEAERAISAELSLRGHRISTSVTVDYEIRDICADVEELVSFGDDGEDLQYCHRLLAFIATGGVYDEVDLVDLLHSARRARLAVQQMNLGGSHV